MMQHVLVFIHVAICSAIWVEPSSPLLPKGTDNMAVGYYSPTHSIFLVGGSTQSDGYVNYVTRYDLATNQYTQHPEITVGSFMLESQGYATIGATLHMWESNVGSNLEQHPYITTFNMATMQYSATAIEKPSSDHYTFNVCLAQVADRYLIALGGSTKPWTYSDRFRIYDTVTNIWLEDGPSLLRGVHAMACGVSTDSNGDQWLYVMGGQDPYTSEGTGHLWDVDRIKVSDMTDLSSSGGWNRLSDHLSYGVYRNRAVVVGDKIYAIAGWKGNDPRTPGSMIDVPAVDIIDVNSNTITTSEDLVSGVSAPGVIDASDYGRIYVFGGSDYAGGSKKNKMQYLQYETTTSTAAPTTTAQATTTKKTATTSQATTAATTASTTQAAIVTRTETSGTSSSVSSTATFTASSTSAFPIATEETKKEILSSLELWLVIVICIILLICVVFVLVLWWRKRNHKTHDNEEYERVKRESKDVTNWLQRIGFENYTELFIRNGYNTLDIVRDITDKKELDEIGITLMGHQNRIIKQIDVLREDRCNHSVNIQCGVTVPGEANEPETEEGLVTNY